MGELDGVWDVRRVGGLLPPLLGLEKRISGARGETRVGSMVGVPFEVKDRSLHYKPPFDGFVDELVPDAEGFAGRAMFRGREYGRFVLRLKEADVASQQLKEQLVKHIDEAHAMEQNVLRMLDGMIKTTEDEEIKSELRHHKLETEQHVDRLRSRLEAHDASPSGVKEAAGIAQALMKGVVDLARSEKAGRNARDGYATEHLEIASYELLERIAQRAGDEETAEAARLNRKDEEAMAKKIAANWDKFAELSLKEEGVTV